MAGSASKGPWSRNRTRYWREGWGYAGGQVRQEVVWCAAPSMRKGDDCLVRIYCGGARGGLASGGLRIAKQCAYVQLTGLRAHVARGKRDGAILASLPFTSDATGPKWIGVVAVQVDGAESGVGDSNNRRDRVQLGCREDRRTGRDGRGKREILGGSGATGFAPSPWPRGCREGRREGCDGGSACDWPRGGGTFWSRGYLVPHRGPTRRAPLPNSTC